MIRVYVAGPYSASNVLDVLRNIGRGEKVCAELFRRGFAPFCPWHDKGYILDGPNHEYTVQQFYDYSMAWLEVSDCVFLIEGWEHSMGTLKEIERANELNIPVFQTLQELINFMHAEETAPISASHDGSVDTLLGIFGIKR